MGNAESSQETPNMNESTVQNNTQRRNIRVNTSQNNLQRSNIRRVPVQNNTQRRYIPVQNNIQQYNIRRVPIQSNSQQYNSQQYNQTNINNIQQQLNNQQQQLEAQSRHQKRLEDQLKIQEENNKMFQDYVEKQSKISSKPKYKQITYSSNNDDQYYKEEEGEENIQSSDYDPYEILGIDKSSTLSDIKRAYKKRALQYHPDRGGNTAIFKIIEKSYRQLLSKYENEHQFENKIKQEVRNVNYDSSMNSGIYNKHVDKDNFDINKFNKVFNEYRLDDENDDGYGNIMDNKSNDNIEVDKTKNYQNSNFSINNFNDNFNKVKNNNSSKKIIEYKEPEALISGDSLGFSELGSGKIDDFSSMNGNIQYTDYKKAHITDTTLINPNKVTYKKYKNLNDIKRDRDNISYKMTSKEREYYNLNKNNERLKEEQRRNRLRDRDNIVTNQFNKINTNMIRQ